jgi:cytochrome c oxidase subunit 3
MATVHTDAHDQAHDEHGHSPYLHHHFETPVQQFESDKMGMWLFLATEILLFGGLFCFYSVWRHNHPDVFHYAHQFLNKKLGATNTIVLIFSSFTMAWSIRAIQTGKKALCAVLLVLTLMCAATFMVIKYFEYSAKIEHGLLWGAKYKPHHEGEAEGAATEGAGSTEQKQATPENEGSVNAAGIGAGMAESTEEKQTSMPVQDTPAVGVSHPAATPEVSSQDVAETTRKAAEHAEPPQGAPATATASGSAGSAEVAQVASPPGVRETELAPDFTYPGGLKLEPSKIKPAALSPAGLVEGGKPHEEHEQSPKNVQTFFAIYFAMTGLHGIHVLIGMIVISIMLGYVLTGKYNKDYWTPIDLTGLYWHVVDLIWIFLFPLLYLIS